MTLNDYFDKIYCINLDRRPDRWEQAVEEFNKIGCKVERLSAIDGEKLINPNTDSPINQSELGCLLSHRAILEKIIKSNGDRFLVLEDDIVFNDDFNQNFQLFKDQLPENWDMVYISGNNTKPIVKVTENIYKTDGTLALHSYFITKKTAISLKKMIDNSNYSMPVDSLFIKYQQTANVFVFRPHLTKQRPGYSDLRGGFRNYDSVLDV
jgi:GR25 family glycosyltransferase involved in LPS biosynthesis